MAIELTDETRKAVHDEDCARLGHQLNIANAMLWEDNSGGRVRGPAGKLAHIKCDRCGQVWLVIEVPGLSYEDIVTKMRARLVDPNSLVPSLRLSATVTDPVGALDAATAS